MSECQFIFIGIQNPSILQSTKYRLLFCSKNVVDHPTLIPILSTQRKSDTFFQNSPSN